MISGHERGLQRGRPQVRPQELGWAQDLFLMAFTALLGAIQTVHLRAVTGWPLLLLDVLSNQCLSLLLAFLILRRPGFYNQHRVPLLVVAKLVRLLAATAGLTLHEQDASPACPRPEAQSSILTLISNAINLLVFALGLQLPIKAHLWVQSLALAVSLSTTRHRCTYDCSAPHLQIMYQRLAGALSRTVGRAFPLATASRRLERLAGGSPAAWPCPCMLVQSWGHFVVGYVLPLLIIDLTEQMAVRVWRISIPRGGHSLKRGQCWGALVALMHMGLLMVASAVSWMGLEVLFRLLGLLGGGLPTGNN